MQKFDETYEILRDMYSDEYYPVKCVDKIKIEIQKIIAFLEEEQMDINIIQQMLDKMTIAINERDW